jgi:MFS family permease
LVIFLTVFIDLLGFGMVLPLLPIYADVFTEDPAGWKLGLLMASFSLMQLIFGPLWGRLSDHLGRRPVLMVGLAGSVVFYLLFGLATVWHSLTLLFVSRIGAGIAGATVPTAQAYIADSTTLERRPKGMALVGVAFGLGFTVGPLLGFLAVPSGQGDPGPGPGYIAAGLSALALLLAIFKLPESRRPDSHLVSPRVWDLAAFRQALAVPSVGLLLLANFICIFSFANFETTLSMLVKGTKEAADSPFQFGWGQVCLTYAYIGFTLALVQGGFVRRLAGRIDEGTLSLAGAALDIVGFALMAVATWQASVPLLLGALAVVVTGVAMMQPSLNSLLSRRSDPRKQGAILGVGQSVSSLGRVLGSGLGIPLLKVGLTVPYYVSLILMVLTLGVILAAVRSGQDYQS